MRVLGIETSCDETGVGLMDADAGVVAEALFSQIETHRPHGGVVPELAARDHVHKLLPLVREAVGDDLLQRVDAVAYTAGPGLGGALLTGAVFGHGLAWALGKPAIGVHHMEAHMLAGALPQAPPLPCLALLVSGGHTQLVAAHGLGRYELLGDTRDDAVGEAFDKVARMLGLDYPGGPEIERLARRGRAGRFVFPRPMANHPGLDFSFSGLKTHALHALHKLRRDDAGGGDEQDRADLAHAFETAAVGALAQRCRRALEQTGLHRLVAVGGVAANAHLRAELAKLGDNGNEVIYPKRKWCTDNGVMIANAGMLRLQAGQAPDPAPRVRARWPLTDLRPPSRASNTASQ